MLKLLGPPNLGNLAGHAAVIRGSAYRVQGRVTLKEVSDDHVVATVKGTVPYDVELWADGEGQLGWSCTCPVFAEDAKFCKHCVATALALTPIPPPRRTIDPDLVDYVATLSRERLIELVLEQAETDLDFRDQLRSEATPRCS
jgi:uncharacterized Zn finger protein